MGVLRVNMSLVAEYEALVDAIGDIYIWREEPVGVDGWAEYYVARVPPADMDIIEVYSIDGDEVLKTYTTPHATFKHKYDDGAEICVARAILALQEAGLNV